MADLRKHSATSNIIRVVLKHATTGQGLTGLTEASSGLVIATIADVEAATTRYRASSSEIETISTLGTFAAPSTDKCRFKEVDSTNHRGLYEIQLANARFSVSNAKRLVVSWTGAANLLDGDYEIQLDAPVDMAAVAGSQADATKLKEYLNGTHFMPVDAHAPDFSVSGTTLTVKEPDGSTTAYTKTITKDAAAEPITGSS